MAADEHPRVRTEAIRGLSFYWTREAVDVLLAAAKQPNDYWTDYTLSQALAANEQVWRTEFVAGNLATSGTKAHGMLSKLLTKSKSGSAAAPHLQTLVGSEPISAEQRDKAMQALAGLRGASRNGRRVFERTCAAGHKVGREGQVFGPELTGVAGRLLRRQIVESIVDPNAHVDEKYKSTQIPTADGRILVGLVVEETLEQLRLFDGKETKTILLADIDQRETLNQSSMPEGLAATISPAEFLDLVEYLANLK